MKRDIGFWNAQGEYIPDIQEIDERELEMNLMQKSYEILDDMSKMVEKFPSETSGKSKAIKLCEEIQDVIDRELDNFLVKSEDENGERFGYMETVSDEGLWEIRRLLDEVLEVLDSAEVE